MVSIALDDDPHFRKIELITSSCILCGACLPTCPTDAIDMNSEMLSIEEPLCYGCGRCEVVCPTSALIMHPFHTNDKLEPVMTHPLVGAVEIHATHADPFQWERFLNEHGHWLTNKLVSLCFPAASLPRERWLDFLAVFEQWNKAYNVPWMLQIDGKPMSGTDEQNASWPALNAAQSVGDAMTWPELVPITISGGVNQWTPLWLAEPLFHLIAGAGVGTMARRYLWDFLDGWDYVMPGPKGHSAIQAARGLVRAFQVERHMSYNEINLLMESAESA
jgi:ferredoxin